MKATRTEHEHTHTHTEMIPKQNGTETDLWRKSQKRNHFDGEMRQLEGKKNTTATATEVLLKKQKQNKFQLLNE